MINNSYSFDKMVSIGNLFRCWDEFRRGKRKRKDIQTFERHREDHIFALQEALQLEKYTHGKYSQFHLFDPKARRISKATVRDRLVHHMAYNMLVDTFDHRFFFHSYSCRKGKGTHQGIHSLQKMCQKVSANNTKPCFVLKMDIFRFFDHIDHQILKELISCQVHDHQTFSLIDKIIDSFRSDWSKEAPVGIPLGNVTSQVFSNIYLHSLDVFIKHVLKEPYYIRFCDGTPVQARNKWGESPLMPIDYLGI